MKVNLVFRKPNPLYFSIEKVFEGLISAFPSDVSIAKTFVVSERADPASILKNLSSIKDKADIFHITGDIHYMSLAFPTKKTVLTIHDCIFMKNTSGMKRRIMQWLWLKLPVKKSAIVTVISESTRKDVIDYTGCDPAKVVVVPDPVGKHFKYVEKIFNPAAIRILQIGAWPNKNLPRVVEAMKGINAELVIVGKLDDAQQNMLHQSGLRYANFYNLDEEALAAQYADADLLIFASTFEGFGLPIIEAQATGRLVITSNLQPMSEVAGGAALLVDPYNIDSIRMGLQEAIGNQAKRDALIQKGLQNVKRYSAETIAAQYHNLYKQLIHTN